MRQFYCAVPRAGIPCGSVFTRSAGFPTQELFDHRAVVPLHRQAELLPHPTSCAGASQVIARRCKSRPPRHRLAWQGKIAAMRRFCFTTLAITSLGLPGIFQIGGYATFTASPAMRQSTRYGNRAFPKGCPVSAEPVICVTRVGRAILPHFGHCSTPPKALRRVKRDMPDLPGIGCVRLDFILRQTIERTRFSQNWSSGASTRMRNLDWVLLPRR